MFHFKILSDIVIIHRRLRKALTLYLLSLGVNINAFEFQKGFEKVTKKYLLYGLGFKEYT